jgi:hypothetical protein
MIKSYLRHTQQLEWHTYLSTIVLYIINVMDMKRGSKRVRRNFKEKNVALKIYNLFTL